MFVCEKCGNESVKWTGQCPFCKEWGSMVEFRESKTPQKSLTKEQKTPIKLSQADGQDHKIPTFSEELNTLFSGGITQGSIILLSGEPGIGKSTLALGLANWIQGEIVYVSGEENEAQIFQRAQRLGVNTPSLGILCESNLETILETLRKVKASLVVLDSISVVTSQDIAGTAGSISQVRAVAEALVSYGKSTNTTVLLIGHVNKDGNLAGPKTLEHLVDTVLYFEGERFEDVRILRSLKNRFGSTGEVALFTMTETGLQDLQNPGLEFISKENDAQTIGSSLSIILEGNRVIVVEIESLSTYTKFGYPKRSPRGIPLPKLDLILAVLSKYSKVNLDSFDVYVNVVRGLKVDDPGVDLSIGASIISGKLNIPLPRHTLYVGEISLTGRIKTCQNLEKRLKEANKLGFQTVVMPDIEVKGEYQITFIKLKDISGLVSYISQNRE